MQRFLTTVGFLVPVQPQKSVSYSSAGHHSAKLNYANNYFNRATYDNVFIMYSLVALIFTIIVSLILVLLFIIFFLFDSNYFYGIKMQTLCETNTCYSIFRY